MFKQINFSQEAAAAKQELVTLQTTVDTLNEQFNLLQIEKETEVDALVKQVIKQFWWIRFSSCKDSQQCSLCVHVPVQLVQYSYAVDLVPDTVPTVKNRMYCSSVVDPDP
jgi:hypothetical protein